MKKFDQKFGIEFISSLPKLPAVYRVYDQQDELIYVGKAKNLRRRLSQYRNAKRRKKHHKMRAVVASAVRIEYDLFETDLDACLQETHLIQVHRPKLNIAGAFYFLYPFIGLQIKDNQAYFCYTTEPENYPGFDFHGAYRSRFITGNAFFSLIKLLRYVGHSIPRQRLLKEKIFTEGKKRAYVFGFRQLDPVWITQLESFFTGRSKEAFEELTLQLLEHSSALRDREEIQEYLNDIKRFWRHEAKRLATVRDQTGYLNYPVPQKERDLVFLKYQMRDQIRTIVR